MVRIRQIIPLALLAGVGCTAMPFAQPQPPQMMAQPPVPQAPQSPVQAMAASVQSAFEPAKPQMPPPATEFQCAFANHLQQLPDPAHGGQTNMGIVGQIFLYSPGPNQKKEIVPAVPMGDVTIYVTDATTRAPGLPAATPEAWHITSNVLMQKRVVDDRYGLGSIAVFLPWPPEWKDVNRLSIQARYDQPNGNTLYSQASTLTLDMLSNTGASAGGSVSSTNNLGAIPDPKVALRQMRMNQNPPASGVTQAAWAAPQQPYQNGPPTGVMPAAWTAPQQPLPYQNAPPAWPQLSPALPYQNAPPAWPQQQPGLPYQNVPVGTQMPVQQPPMAWGAPNLPPPNLSMQQAAPPVDQQFVIPRHQ